MRKILLITFIVMMIFTGCTAEKEVQETDISSTAEELGYEQISQEETQRIMDTEDNIIILDVRTQQEFDEGHIPNAICIPNETITDDDIAQLPDKQQTILVYCRSGRRSKEASKKLSLLGYTNIKEFGGIIDWIGEVVK